MTKTYTKRNKCIHHDCTQKKHHDFGELIGIPLHYCDLHEQTGRDLLTFLQTKTGLTTESLKYTKRKP